MIAERLPQNTASLQFQGSKAKTAQQLQKAKDKKLRKQFNKDPTGQLANLLGDTDKLATAMAQLQQKHISSIRKQKKVQPYENYIVPTQQSRKLIAGWQPIKNASEADAFSTISKWMDTQSKKPQADRSEAFKAVTQAMKGLQRAMPKQGVPDLQFWQEAQYALDYLAKQKIPSVLINKYFLQLFQKAPAVVSQSYKTAGLTKQLQPKEAIFPGITKFPSFQAKKKLLRRLSSGTYYQPQKVQQKLKRNDAYLKLYKGLSSKQYNLSDTLKQGNLKDGYLSLFPAWAMKQMKQTKKTAEKSLQLSQKFNELTAKNSGYWKDLAGIGQAKWNQGKKIWQGQEVQAFTKRMDKRAVVIQKRVNKNAFLLKKVLDDDQIKQQVPAFLAQLVEANSLLSSTGFGPISKKSSSLYAGRWMDRTTGSLRLLPTANAKWINPTSLQQKLGYLQAKILNHWNNCISSYDEYNKLKQREPDLAEATAKRIQNGGNTNGVNIGYANFIRSTIINFTKQYSLALDATPKRYILKSVGPQNLKVIYDMKPVEKIQDTQTNRTNIILTTDIQKKIASWQQILQQTFDSIMQQIDSNDDWTMVQKVDAQGKISNGYLSLVNYGARKVNTAIKTLLRTSIPTKLSYSWINDSAEQLEETRQSLNRSLKAISGQSFSPQTYAQIKDLTKDSAKQIRQGIYNSDPVVAAKAFDTLQKNAYTIRQGLPEAIASIPQHVFRAPAKKKTFAQYYENKY